MVKGSSFKLVWDRSALDHLKDILEYLREQSTEAPKLLKKAILDRVQEVSKNPFIFEIDKLKEPLDKNFRAFIVYSYRVTYQVVPDLKEIRILRIRHTSREPLGY